MIVYFNSRLMRKEEVRISPDDRGFLFGDGVYEVICACDGNPFRPDEHFERLKRSLQEIEIEFHELPGLRRAMADLLRANGLEQRHAKIYVQITRGVADRQHAFPEEPPPPTVYASVIPYEPPRKKWRSGVKAILTPDNRWGRCDIKAIGLLPNVLASQRAKEAGAYDAIFVRDETIMEGSHTNVLGIFDETLVTHPANHHILAGVTRACVLELARGLGIDVEERPIRQSELSQVDELILVGTTTGVMPVTCVDDLVIGGGQPGPITGQLQGVFLEQTGLRDAK